ncbi:hypothetical protein [Neobacillus piezotolerans]|nr:hypothetical protein [Neobacillus piezotolerans]
MLAAIKEGMRKEDFVEYRKYMKYQIWTRERLSINEDGNKF